MAVAKLEELKRFETSMFYKGFAEADEQRKL